MGRFLVNFILLKTPGLVTAIKLAKMGANVTIIARNQKKLDEAMEQIEAAATSDSQILLQYSCDVSDHKAVARTIKNAVESNQGKIG